MIFRATILLLAALLCSSCKDKPSIEIGPIYTTGPTSGPDGEILANVISFHYHAKDPEPINFLVDGKQIKTVEIKGKGEWRIEVDDGNMTITEGGLILELPAPHEGVLSSNVSTNESNQMVFDLAIGDSEVLRIECPNQVVDSTIATDEAESGRREILTPAPHTTGHTDP